MIDRSELAYKYFHEGCNCAEAVICAFSDKIGLSEETCMAMACGFGGGVGGSHSEICGAVSGAVLVLSLMHPHTKTDNDGKKAVYALVKSLRERFSSIFGTTRCSDLPHANVTADERTPAALRLGLTKCCDIVVVTAAEILGSMLSE